MALRNGEHQATAESLRSALATLDTQTTDTLEIYSDGSHKRAQQEGTYAWEIGMHADGYWRQLDNGGGKCAQNDNPHVPITSTRMEALGFLRAAERLRAAGWAKKVTATMDNQGVTKRFLKHKDERHRKQWRKPDWDLWQAIRAINTEDTRLLWVEGHAEKRKKPSAYTAAEARNVAMDEDAEKHYQDTSTDKPWEQHSGPVAIDGLPLTSGIKQALERNARTRITMEFLAKRCARKGDETLLDTNIMDEVRRAEARSGMLTKSLRITHVLWATNEYLSAAKKRDTNACPLCGAANETNGHLKAHCPEASVKGIREQMVRDIAEIVQDELGDSMPDAAWQALAAQWSERSLARCHPETAKPSLTGIRCKPCRKHHKCQHRGKEGHLPEPQTEDDIRTSHHLLAPESRAVSSRRAPPQKAPPPWRSESNSRRAPKTAPASTRSGASLASHAGHRRPGRGRLLTSVRPRHRSATT